MMLADFINAAEAYNMANWETNGVHANGRLCMLGAGLAAVAQKLIDGSRVIELMPYRKCWEPEDAVYSIMGLLGVSIIPEYGIGKNRAWWRLQRAGLDEGKLGRTAFLYPYTPSVDKYYQMSFESCAKASANTPIHIFPNIGVDVDGNIIVKCRKIYKCNVGNETLDPMTDTGPNIVNRCLWLTTQIKSGHCSERLCISLVPDKLNNSNKNNVIQVLKRSRDDLCDDVKYQWKCNNEGEFEACEKFTSVITTTAARSACCRCVIATIQKTNVDIAIYVGDAELECGTELWLLDVGVKDAYFNKIMTVVKPQEDADLASILIFDRLGMSGPIGVIDTAGTHCHEVQKLR